MVERLQADAAAAQGDWFGPRLIDSVPRELRLPLGDEGLVGAPEVARLHADGLRLGLGLDRLLEASSTIPG